jgi:hypothetical protein
MLRITALGYRPMEVQNVEVQLGAIAGLGELTLEAAPVELQPLVVTAPAVTLDPVRTTVGARLDEEDLAALPAQRDYKTAIVILPHVNESHLGDPPNVGGSTGIENMYFVDGINVTSELTATTSITLPYNFVRALEVKAGGYEARYGRSLGAVVNAVTHSGTNEFETAVFGFFTSAGLSAESKSLFTLHETGAASYDFGARVSGPIVRNRLWFSAAYNPRIDRVDKEITGLGVYDDRRTAHLFAGKLTWQTSPDMNLVLSVFGDPTVHHAVDPISFLWPENFTPLAADPYLRRKESGGVAGILRAMATPASWLMLEGSVGHSRTKASHFLGMDTTQAEPLFVDYVASTVSGTGAFDDVEQGRTTLLLSGTAEIGRHTVAAGFEYEDARVTAEVGIPRVERWDPAQWVVVEEGSPRGTFHNRLPTAYLQDSWRITDRLTVNAGLRWSAQILTGASGSTRQKFPDEWQPRLGFSWQVDRGGTHRVFGSYGRFYQQIPLHLSRLWYVDYTYVFSYYSEDPRPGDATPDSVNDWSSTEEDVVDWGLTRIQDIEVENFDEFTLGYEGLVGGARLTLRGILRDLRSSFQWGRDENWTWVVGTPGKGDFDFLPPPKRTYTALELSATGGWQRLQYRASYVLSRTWGNFNGLFQSDLAIANPGSGWTFGRPDHAANTEGFLANDRPHVVKLTAAYQTPFGLTPGLFFSWMSGTPINEWGRGPTSSYLFLVPRGTAGRTPPIWDLNLRLAYALPLRGAVAPRVVLDFLHLGNPQRTVRVDQQHYFSRDADGNQTNENANYLAPLAYQPPTTIRLGVEISF